MSSLEARRQARQRKILANQETRLNRILDKGQTVDGISSLESFQDLLEVKQHTSFQPQTSHESLPLSEVERASVDSKQEENQDQPSERLSPPITSEDTFDNKNNGAPKAKKTIWSVLVWLLFGIVVRFSLSHSKYSWIVLDNGFVPFATSIVAVYLANPINSLGETNAVVKYLTIGMQLLGIQQTARTRLQNLFVLTSDLLEKFSSYFMGFVVCNMILYEY